MTDLFAQNVSQLPVSSPLLFLLSLFFAQMVMPGEDANITLELITDIPLEEGQRYTLREGHKTVGTGIVSKILE